MPAIPRQTEFENIQRYSSFERPQAISPGAASTESRALESAGEQIESTAQQALAAASHRERLEKIAAGRVSSVTEADISAATLQQYIDDLRGSNASPDQQLALANQRHIELTGELQNRLAPLGSDSVLHGLQYYGSQAHSQLHALHTERDQKVSAGIRLETIKALDSVAERASTDPNFLPRAQQEMDRVLTNNPSLTADDTTSLYNHYKGQLQLAPAVNRLLKGEADDVLMDIHKGKYDSLPTDLRSQLEKKAFETASNQRSLDQAKWTAEERGRKAHATKTFDSALSKMYEDKNPDGLIARLSTDENFRDAIRWNDGTYADNLYNEARTYQHFLRGKDTPSDPKVLAQVVLGIEDGHIKSAQQLLQYQGNGLSQGDFEQYAGVIRGNRVRADDRAYQQEQERKREGGKIIQDRLIGAFPNLMNWDAKAQSIFADARVEYYRRVDELKRAGKFGEADLLTVGNEIATKYFAQLADRQLEASSEIRKGLPFKDAAEAAQHLKGKALDDYLFRLQRAESIEEAQRELGGMGASQQKPEGGAVQKNPLPKVGR